MKYCAQVGDRTFEIELGDTGVVVNGEPIDAEFNTGMGSGVGVLRIGKRSMALMVEPGTDNSWTVIRAGGERESVVVEDPRDQLLNKFGGSTQTNSSEGVLRAPMPGLVLKVNVSEGDVVAEGDGMLVLEAMKMENELKSPNSGKVVSVLVVPGQAVNKGSPLIEVAEQG